ncbi:MAG: dTDP-4-dehydrorhamnose 3,5-epimerase [Geminicoccaceae bacterium]
MAASITSLSIPEVKVIVPDRFGDDRGFFSETYSRRSMADAGIEEEFVQDNHSLSALVGTVRGLHYQLPPFAQAKLVRVVRGAVVDVAVDIRWGSPTFGQHVAVTLSAAAWNQIYVPVGFAHGFCTLEPDTEVVYKVTAYYSRAHDRGISWNDPELGIAWPVESATAQLSDKDRNQPRLADVAVGDLFDFAPDRE